MILFWTLDSRESATEERTLEEWMLFTCCVCMHTQQMGALP